MAFSSMGAECAAQPCGRPAADVVGASQYDRMGWCLHADMWCHVHTLLTPLLQRGADQGPGCISMEARAMALDVVWAPLELIDLPEPRHLHLLHRQGSRPQSHPIMSNVRGCARVWGSRVRKRRTCMHCNTARVRFDSGCLTAKADEEVLWPWPIYYHVCTALQDTCSSGKTA